MVHPVYRFWGMPRRIRLIFEDVATPCGLCGELSKTAATNYVTRPNGNKYQGPWRHPLTPYRIQADNNPFPVEAAVDGAGYRHWLGLTLGQKSGKVTVEPAHVVRAFAARCKDLDGDRPGFRVRAYGYDMENMKARGFCYGEMPAWILPDAKLRNAFAFEVQRLVSAADQAAWTLKKAVFDAFIHEKRGGRQRTGLASRKLFVMFSARFWAVTEPKFYAMLPEVHQAVRDRGETFPIRQAWRRQLETAAMDLFEEATAAAGSGGGDIKRVAKAQRALRFAVGPWSKEMQKRLDLPPPTPAGEAKEEETLA
jgi:CRISPR system Cascade subunit CasA